MEKGLRVGRGDGAEERVEAVLARLRSAQPAAGLEERVLQRLSARAEVQPVRSRGFSEWFGSSISWRGGLAWGAVCLAALLMLAPFIHHGRTAGQRFARSDRSGATAQSGAAGQSGVAARPEEAAAMRDGSRVTAAEMVDAANRTIPQPPRRAISAPRTLAKVPAGKGIFAIGQADQHSPKQLVNEPAPAEALTAQEHLLLRLGRHHAPQQLMAMTPAAEEAQGTAERKQYAMFFAPAFRTVEEIEAMQKEAKQ